MDKDKKITDAVEILHRRYYEGKPERLKELALERIAETRKVHEPECANRSSVEKDLDLCICKELE